MSELFGVMNNRDRDRDNVLFIFLHLNIIIPSHTLSSPLLTYPHSVYVTSVNINATSETAQPMYDMTDRAMV